MTGNVTLELNSDTSHFQNEVQQRVQDKILVPSGLFSERRKNRRVARHFLDEHVVSLPFFFHTLIFHTLTFLTKFCKARKRQANVQAPKVTRI